MYNDFKLLVDGENAFNEILSCIDNAKHVIKINMFIWRDDEIGNEIGNGKFGSVKIATHRITTKQVAIKVVSKIESNNIKILYYL